MKYVFYIFAFPFIVSWYIVKFFTYLMILAFHYLLVVPIKFLYHLITKMPVNYSFDFGKHYTLKELDAMEGHKFEYACADILKANGYKNVKVTQGSGDFGVDITAEKNNFKYAVQCKCYSHKLDNTPIQEVVGGLAYYGCTKGMVMTNNYFTEPAKQLAAINNVELWDRDILQTKLKKTTHTPTKIKIQDSKATEPINESVCNKLNIKSTDIDSLVYQAITIIVETGNASTVFLQRKLKLGFPRAAKIIDEIEEMGIIGPQEGSSPRKINITKEEWYELRKSCHVIGSVNTADEVILKKQQESNLLLFAQKSNLLLDLDEYPQKVQEFVKRAAEYLIYYCQTNDLYIMIEKIDILYESNEVLFELSLHGNTKVSQIKSAQHKLADYISVKYVKYIYPTTTPHTVGLKIPLPDYYKRTSMLIHEFNK